MALLTAEETFFELLSRVSIRGLLGGIDPRRGHGLPHGFDHIPPDLFGVMLNPAGRWENLRQLALGRRDGAAP